VASILTTLQNMSLVEPAGPEAAGDPPLSYRERHAAVFKVFEASKTRSSAECQRRMHRQEIALLGDDPLARRLAERLPQYGFEQISRAPLDGWPAPGGGPRIVVLAVSDYHSGEALAAANRRAVAAGETLVPVHCQDGVASIGPTVVPGKTACLACLELRLVSNVDNQEALASYRSFVAAQGRRYPDLPGHFDAVAVFVAHELLRVSTGYEPARSHNGILRLDLWNSDLRRGRVLRFPSCTVCSARARRPKYDDHAFAAMLARL
jgi:bacteriocin biosynthesis cyclodehydratase domain-containing protein